MKHTKASIDELNSRERIALINSCSGFKPANLIGTCDADQNTNLAIMSSVVHLGASPALLGLVIRPDSVQRDTLSNIRDTGYYTINHVGTGFVEQAHHTAARYEKDVSEFDRAGLTVAWQDDFPAPYVGESPVQIGMKLVEESVIKHNGVHFIIGEIEQLYFDQNIQNEDGSLDLSKADVACVSGLDCYLSTTKIVKLPYAKPR